MFGSILSGAQTTMHDWRMFRQLIRTLMFWACTVTVISGAWSAWQIWQDRPQQVKAAVLYLHRLEPVEVGFGSETLRTALGGGVAIGEFPAAQWS